MTDAKGKAYWDTFAETLIEQFMKKGPVASMPLVRQEIPQEAKTSAILALVAQTKDTNHPLTFEEAEQALFPAPLEFGSRREYVDTKFGVRVAMAQNKRLGE